MFPNRECPPELDRAIEMVLAGELVHSNLEKLMAEEIRRLREQLRDCSVSFGIFDEGCSSEYWERYPGNPSHE